MGNTTLIDYLNDIARAVQAKTKKTNKIKLKDLADEIDGIDSLDTHEFANNATNPLTINSNGEYNIYDDNFSHIVVNIPFAGDDLAPYFQNQTGDGPYTMVYYNHMLPGMISPGIEAEEADPESETEEVSEVGYSSYDFNIGDGSVAFLTYNYNSSSNIYADHSVSFYKHNIGNSEILARENYHLSGNSGDIHYSDIRLVDLNTGSSDNYPAIYYNSSGYLTIGNNIATPGYVSWRDNATDNMSSVEMGASTIIYKNNNIIATTLPKGNSGSSGWLTVAHIGTGSDNDIRTQRMNSGSFYYIDSNCGFNNTGSALVAYYNNSTDSVNSLDSSDDDKILYYNSSSQYFEANSLSDSEIFYDTADGKEIGNLGYGSPAGIYAYRYDSDNQGVYLQRLSDQNGFNRILVGAGYNDTRFQTYNCIVDRALYFTVSSGKTYINSLDLNRYNSATNCSIIIPSIVSTPYNYTFSNNVIPTSSTYAFTNYSQETHTANVYAKEETLTTKNIAYLTTGVVGGNAVAYGAVTDLYDTNYSISTPSKDALSIIKVAYYSTSDYNITVSPIYDNNVLKVYHLGTDANDNYCVTSTSLSYSYSDSAAGYTNNFITVLYPHITDYSNDSTKEKASISSLTVTPNRYYTLKYYNDFSSIDDVDISPIKLGTATPTYNWTAPADGEESPTSSKVFGYIRVYQFTNGSSVDVPVTYEMITALANAGLIDTNYMPPVAA